MTDKEVWTTLKTLTWTKEFFLSKGIVNARLEAEWLLCAVTGLDRVGLYLQFDKPLNESELAEYRVKVARRAKREPLQHILGSQDFFGLDYEVTADVLVPRHETEVLVSEAFIRHPEAATILDIGTGSGCIAVSLKKLFTKAAVTATDISEAALVVARRNAEKFGVAIEFLAGSLFTPITGRSFDLIVSNPPYIPSAKIELLEPEVRDYDPRFALDGGKDGLDIYRELIPGAVACLKPGGWLLVEIGAGQAEDVTQLYRNTACFTEPDVSPDHAGIVRVLGAQIKDKP